MSSFSLSRLLRTGSSNSQSRPPAHKTNAFQVLTFRPSPFDQSATLIERANADHTTTALFSISSQKGSKEVQIHRIGAGNTPIQPTLIGSSKYSSMRSSTEISLAGQSTKMRESNMADGYKFSVPPFGNMKWKTKMSGALVLQDENKQELAKYESSAGFKGAGAAKFEVLVPGDDYLLDVIIVTGMAAVKMWEKDKQAIEVVAEVVGGIAG